MPTAPRINRFSPIRRHLLQAIVALPMVTLHVLVHADAK